MSPDKMVSMSLLLSAALFSLGLVGVLLRRNIITVLLCIELMLNAVNLAFIAFSRHWAAHPSLHVAHGSIDAQVLVFFVLTVAAAEAAVGLAIVIALHRKKDTLDVDAFDVLKW
jgi:NADH-quinone oxidoreductase subunit K